MQKDGLCKKLRKNFVDNPLFQSSPRQVTPSLSIYLILASPKDPLLIPLPVSPPILFSLILDESPPSLLHTSSCLRTLNSFNLFATNLRPFQPTCLCSCVSTRLFSWWVDREVSQRMSVLQFRGSFSGRPIYLSLCQYVGYSSFRVISARSVFWWTSCHLHCKLKNQARLNCFALLL